ncbi:very short patch repair endonuclease [Actinopolyspora mzabensis]|uniref:very short patch repair endonuclease n=1 Tax=Actinopolyspora mzabensis TaxID=995066 RepID=UPI002481B9D0|nr:very short patch repair endonuclease [Actinopolyspora mzabensis]
MKKPSPSSSEVSQRMRKQATRHTQVELKIRKNLHALGLRYRLHQRPIHGIRREADIVFSKCKLAVFVDGCFWHFCPAHGMLPKSNSDWWSEKLLKNRNRDQETDYQLSNAGWSVVRIWEHEEPAEAAQRIYQLVTHLNHYGRNVSCDWTECAR